MLCFFKHIFDRVTIAERFAAAVHAQLEEAGMQPGCANDEEFGVVDCLFLLNFSQEQLVNAVFLELLSRTWRLHWCLGQLPRLASTVAH